MTGSHEARGSSPLSSTTMISRGYTCNPFFHGSIISREGIVKWPKMLTYGVYAPLSRRRMPPVNPGLNV